MPAPYPGGCLCGATRYRVTEEPLTVYACHCTDCQKRTGAAFGLSMWVRRSAVEVTKGEAAVHSSLGADGSPRQGRICAQCSTRLWSEPPKHAALAVVRPGTLDDTSWLKPVAHIWTRSAQPWFVFPPDAVKIEKQPTDLREMMTLWKNRAT